VVKKSRQKRGISLNGVCVGDVTAAGLPPAGVGVLLSSLENGINNICLFINYG